MSRLRADTRLSNLADDVELSDDDTPCALFNFPEEVSHQNNSTSPLTTIKTIAELTTYKIDDTLAYISEIVAERQQTYNLLLAELKIANTKKLFEICLKQQNASLVSCLPSAFLLLTCVQEQIAAVLRNTISDSLISEIIRATAGGELTEENNIRFWALCMKKNAYGEHKKMLNVPERPSGLSEAGKVVLWKVCSEMNEYGPLKGRIEMPEKPEGIEDDTKEDIKEGVHYGRRRTLMMDGEWHQAIIHERHDGLVDSMIAELDEATLEDEREEDQNADSIMDRPRFSISSDSSWESFYSDAEEQIDAEDARALNRRSWNEGHELR